MVRTWNPVAGRSTIGNITATLRKGVPESKSLNIYRNSLRRFIEREKNKFVRESLD